MPDLAVDTIVELKRIVQLLVSDSRLRIPFNDIETAADSIS